MGTSPTRPPSGLLPLPALLETLEALEVEWKPKGETIAVRDPFGVLTGSLKKAIAEHKPALIALFNRRAALTKCHAYLERLRREDPPKGTRADGVRWLRREVQRLADLCDLRDHDGHALGYTDPQDPFAADAMLALVEDLGELTAPGNPYPLGPMDERMCPADRRHNGKPLTMY